MADEEARQRAVRCRDRTGRGLGGTEASPKAPGWYPDRASPSDQSYWDGQNWTAKRRWTSGQGWLVAGDAPEEAMRDASPPLRGPRLSANPYSRTAPRRSKATGFTFNLGVLLLLICGIGLMYGSVGLDPRERERRCRRLPRVSVNGIDPAFHPHRRQRLGDLHRRDPDRHLRLLRDDVRGGAALHPHDDHRRRDGDLRHLRHVPHCAEDLAGAGSREADVSVGWGLICVLSAAVLALLIALVRLLQR